MNEVVEVAPASAVHKSRWGYHPCDYQTFLLIRKIHKAYRKAQRQGGSLKRWLRKQPQNRVSYPRERDSFGRWVRNKCADPTPVPRPEVNAAFVNVVNHSWLGDYVTVNDAGIVNDYINARTPRANRDSVVPLKLSRARIEELAAMC